jgi:hypothetical protein
MKSYTYIPLTFHLQRGSRSISDISPRLLLKRLSNEKEINIKISMKAIKLYKGIGILGIERVLIDYQ